MEKSIAHSRFEKRTLRISNDVQYTLYYGIDAAVIEEQVKGCDDDNTSTTFGKQNTFLHVLNTPIGIHVCKAVEHEVKWFEDPDVYWKGEKHDGVVSTADCLQLISDN